MQDIKKGTHSPQSEEGLTADTLKSIQAGESYQEAMELAQEEAGSAYAAMMGFWIINTIAGRDN